MLLEFRCQNFASIRDEAVLSLMPSDIGEQEECLLRQGGCTALPETVISGANASGKSSLLRALGRALSIIRESSERQVNEPVPAVPFRFDCARSAEPSSFGFTFVASDGRKYVYGFSADTERVHEERLFRCSGSGRQLIMRRDGDSYEYGSGLGKELDPLRRMNTPNKLFLSTATCWNSKATAAPYIWLSEMIDTSAAGGGLRERALSLYREHGKEYTAFTAELFHEAGIGIDDIEIEWRIMDNAGSVQLINGMYMAPRERYLARVTAVHTVKGADGGVRSCRLPLGEE